MEVGSFSSAALYSNAAARAQNSNSARPAPEADAANGVRPESVSSARQSAEARETSRPAAETERPDAVRESASPEPSRNAEAEGGRSTDGTTRNQPRDGLGTLVDISV